MDQNKIIEALRATLEPSLREQAEAFLTEVQKIISFVPQLLHIVVNPEIDVPVRQAGAVYLKNMITQHWSDDEETRPGQPVPFSIHENDKQIIRDNIVEAIINQRDPIRVQLAVSVSIIVKNDYPGRWPGIADKIMAYLSSPNHDAYLGSLICLYQLVKHFEYKKPEDRNALNGVMVHALPIMHRLCTQLLPDLSENSAILQKQILKIFFALVQFCLPMDLVNKEVFSQWINLARDVIQLPVPAECDSLDESERGDLVWWKCKKWAVNLMTRCFERYGSPGSVLKDYNEFAGWFLKTYAVDCLHVLMMVLDRYVKKEFVAQRVLQLSLQYISIGIKHATTWKCLKPHMPVLIKGVIFPLFGHTEEDQELWLEDPVEFIKVKYDIYEEFFSPTTAAEGLLVDAVSKRKETLQMAMTWSIGVISSEDPKLKDQALHMIGVLADVLLKKKLYKNQIEDMMKIHVFPHFSSQHGFLRARACWMVNMFGRAKFRDAGNVQIITENLINLLGKDPELPVRVEAAIGLQKILSEQTKAKEIMVPCIQQIFRDLLKLIRETETDNVTGCLQNFVYSFVEELKPLAVEITSHLAQTFAAVIESSSASSEDKSITAIGLLNTLETICHVLEDQKEVLSCIEGIIVHVIQVILKNNVTEYFEEMLSLIYSLTSPQVTEQMWTALPIIFDLFKRDDNVDYFTDMMPALHNYITVDPRAFLAEPSRMEIIYSMAKMVLNGTLGDAGEDAESHAAKLLEIMLLQFKDIPELVCKMMPLFLELVISRLSRPLQNTELRTMCLQVVLAAIFINPSLTLAYLSEVRLPNQEGTMVRHFLQQVLQDTDCFLGLHDRKMFVLGLCTLMSLPTNLRPADIEDLAAKFLPSLIVIFKGLKKVYEYQSQEEEDSDDENAGDEEVEELENEDEEDVIDNEEEEYIQQLEKCSGDDYEDDDEDDYDETLLENYDTLVDGENSQVDEYQMFRTVVEGISSVDGMWYQVLTRNLVEDDRKHLEDIFRLAEQRRAAQESKKIEQAGGYNFTVTQVPSSFCFGGAPSS